MRSLLTAPSRVLGSRTALAWVAACSLSCHRSPAGEGVIGAATPQSDAAPGDAASRSEPPTPGDAPSAAALPSASVAPAASQASLRDDAGPRARELKTTTRGPRPRLTLERPVDLGPAAPVTATARGVIFRQGPAELVGIRATGSPAEVASRAGARRSFDGGVSLRWAAPVVTRRGQSYWVARGKLLRRAFDWAALSTEGDVETLASDALDGARVSAVSATDAVDLVTYIARPSGSRDERRARLWSTVAGAIDLSESGAGASSLTLAGSDTHWVAVWLDGRAAMSPVHGRAIDLDAGGDPRLGADVVVFVGPSPEGATQVNALASRDGVAAFIPFARDTTAFGLAVLDVGASPHLDARVVWTPYPNGIEPAPVDSAVVCGSPWVAYVHPRAAAPEAPAVLALGHLIDDGTIEEEASAAEGFDFLGVSLAAREGGGAWLAWVGNGRAWVRGVACP